jgi:hypothetical protein
MSETPFMPGEPSRPSPDIRRDPGVPGAPAPDPVPDPLPDPAKVGAEEGIGATEEEVGDRTGPAVGYDQEPKQTKDNGGVAQS